MDAERRFAREGLGYSLYASGGGLESGIPDDPGLWAIRIRGDYLARRSGELTGEVVVSWTDREPSHLLRTKLNFSVDSSRDKLASALVKRAGGIPWRMLLEDFCVSTLLTEERGTPAETIGQRADKPAEADQISGMVPYKKPTLLFAHGGTGKGWLSLLMAVCIATGRPFLGRLSREGTVGILDWEDDGDVADRRLKKLCRGMNIPTPELHYRRMVGPLRRQLHSVAEWVSKFGITCLIVDSANWAIGTSEWDNATSGFFEALQYLDVTAIIIDHVAKAVAVAGNEAGEGTPYGDVYKHNAARATWEIRKQQTAGDDFTVLGLWNRKANHDKLSEPFAVKLSFGAEAVKAELVDIVEDTNLLPENKTAKKAIQGLLRDGPRTKAEIDAALYSWAPKTLEVALTRGRQDGTFYLSGGRWGTGVAPEAAAPEASEPKPKRRRFEQLPMPEPEVSSWDD
ncbi:MAG: AAA family ATPase [Chloroflexota bacterium]|nr:AAA family ATPase [Chloroflexota bacterium]